MQIIYFVLALIAVYLIILGIPITRERLIAQNTYQCAVYGLKPDCKTPLPIEKRLK